MIIAHTLYYNYNYNNIDIRFTNWGQACLFNLLNSGSSFN